MSLWRATSSGPFITKREQWLWVVLSRWERWKAGGLENVSSEFIVAGVTGPSKMELQRKSELCRHELQGAGPGGEERMSRDLTSRTRLFVVGLTPFLSVSIVRTLDFWVTDCHWILKRKTGSALCYSENTRENALRRQEIYSGSVLGGSIQDQAELLLDMSLLLGGGGNMNM